MAFKTTLLALAENIYDWTLREPDGLQSTPLQYQGKSATWVVLSFGPHNFFFI